METTTRVPAACPCLNLRLSMDHKDVPAFGAAARPLGSSSSAAAAAAADTQVRFWSEGGQGCVYDGSSQVDQFFAAAVAIPSVRTEHVVFPEFLHGPAW